MTGEATRRGVLAGMASIAAGVGGCLGVTGSSRPISILAAGSLQNALGDGLAAATEERLSVEAHGSRHAAQLVEEGQRDPDILALADTALFDAPLSEPWHATFVSNAVVLAYNPDSDAGQRVPEADNWIDPVLASSFRLGRTSPDLDPLGYRTLLAFELAATHYDRPGLRDRMVDSEQVYPETQLLAQFETGSIDGAFVYRNMAVEREYPFVDLPAAIDLSDPERADTYATVSVTLSDGTTVTGSPIAYGATLRRENDRSRAVFDTLVASTDDYLGDSGFVDRETYPTYHGNVPERISG